MKLALRRGLACLPLLSVLLLASCQQPPAQRAEPLTIAGYPLAPANVVFDLERENMKTAWRVEYGQTTRGTLSHICSVGDYLVAEGADHQVHVYNAADFGRYKSGVVMEGPLQAPPAVYGNKLLLTSNNRIFTFDVDAGTLGKGLRTRMPVSATPLIFKDSLILAGEDGDVARVSMTNLEPLWIKSIDGPILDQPVMDNGIIYTDAQMGEAIALQAEDGKELWRLKPTGPAKFSSGIAVYGKTCYVGDQLGTLYGLDAEFGKVTWRKSLPAPVVGVPQVVGDKVFVFTNQPGVACLKAGDGPDSLWTLDGACKLLATSKTLGYFLMKDNCIAAVALADGKELWRDPMPKGTMVAGSASRPEFFIANAAGAIVAIAELE